MTQAYDLVGPPISRESACLTIHDPFEKTLASTHVRHLRGKQSILTHQALLHDFAATTGQHASMHGLQIKIGNEYSRRKTPHLIFIVQGQDVAAPLTIQSLLGCVLFFEYAFASWNTGLFATGDSTGVGTVIARAEIRAQVAALASSAALRHGRMALACFRSDCPDLTPIVFPQGQHGLWAAQVRDVYDELRLCPTYELTLKTLGKRTRTHLRSYRRHAQSETCCVFVPDAASHIPTSQLASLNTSSLKPLDQRTFDLQFHATSQLPGGFVCGLRAADGRWLALAGGWRQGTTSLLQWQMNAAAFPRLSLSTAFRAFLIEHEVSLGTTRLCFLGGTPHSIAHAFQQGYAVDLIVRRPGLLTSLLIRLIPYLAQRNPALANRGNFLIDALRHRVHWTHVSQVQRPVDHPTAPRPQRVV